MSIIYKVKNYKLLQAQRASLALMPKLVSIMVSHERCNPTRCSIHLAEYMTNRHRSESLDEALDVTERIDLQLVCLILDPTDNSSSLPR